MRHVHYYIAVSYEWKGQKVYVTVENCGKFPNMVYIVIIIIPYSENMRYFDVLNFHIVLKHNLKCFAPSSGGGGGGF